ncbi:MAG: TonB-dependent receptor plug domain-containing protein [Chitinispirillales bacterium]|jgi:outer membrane cobalamin receptor|nr:TonB-dependent receptor plug domain-containing protein [Chitinispirillales bacterium]
MFSSSTAALGVGAGGGFVILADAVPARLRAPFTVLSFALAASSQVLPAGDIQEDSVIIDNNANTIVSNDNIVITDSDDFEITVKHRAVAPLSPSSRIIKASEFRGKFADLPSVLESVSGVDIRSMGGYGQYAESYIRGGTALGVRVYLDGVLLNSASAGAADLSKIPLDKITEIRVAKSASGLRQMGSGMGGVIELFTADDGNSHGITGINIEAGSFGSLKGSVIIKRNGGKTVHQYGDTSIQPTRKNARFSHQINIDASKSDNDYPFVHDNGTTLSTLRAPDPTWDDTLMRKSNNYYRSIDAAYSLSVDISENHRINQKISAGAYGQGLFVYHYKENQSGSTSGNTAIYGMDYQGEFFKRLILGAEASGIMRRSALRDPDAHFGLGGAKNIESNGVTADFLLDARYLFTDNFHIAGLTGARYDGYARQSRERNEKPEMSRYEYRTGTEAVVKANIGKSSTTETALRAVYKYEIDTLSAGFNNNLSSAPKNYSLGYPTAEAVFKMGINPVTLQLSAAASKRSPTFFERFGWSGGFISNPDLREETRVEADAGVSIDLWEYSAAVSVFGGTVGDKIKSIPYSLGFVKVMNFADTKFYGAEFDFSAKPLRFFTAELSAAYLKSVINGAKDPSWHGRIEPFVPEFSGFLKTEVDIWKFNIGHGIKYESACYMNIENIVTRPQQTELSAWASCKIDKSLLIRYRVDNYINTANFDFLDNPKPRRTHTVELSFRA